MKFFRSLTTRIVLNHLLVAIISSVLIGLFVLMLLEIAVRNIKPEVYGNLISYSVIRWQVGKPDREPLPVGNPAGYSIIISADNTVLHNDGTSPCKVGDNLAACAPELLNSPSGNRFFPKNGENWVEYVQPLKDGNRIIMRFGPPKADIYLILGETVIQGALPVLLITSLTTAVFALPVALIFAWFSVRRVTKRIRKVTTASQKFAAGDLSVRVNDKYRDEVGELAGQFDSMAEALEQNVVVLRDLVKRNEELTQKAETSAIQTERLRLSRDLHDDIAQSLFSLSVTASSLPNRITQEPEASVHQAKAIAELAEQTLLNLRSILVELRPSTLVEYGLAEALRKLTEDWQTNNHIPVNLAVYLGGSHIPVGVQEVIFRVAQEGLTNIAKHAKATAVDMSLVEGQSQIMFSLTDDGIGFKSENARNNARFGLISMQERTRAIGGSLAIESDTQKGTTIRLKLPLFVAEVAK